VIAAVGVVAFYRHAVDPPPIKPTSEVILIRWASSLVLVLEADLRLTGFGLCV
jgi:hypothetical protein